MLPLHTFRVMAAGQNSDDITVAFVTMSNKMSKESAEAHLEWVEEGPKIKWLVEKELFARAGVERVVFCLDTE